MEHIGRLLGRSKSARACVSAEEIAKAGWKAAVGKRLADRAQAVALVRSRLVVAVEDAVWQRQLRTLEGQILKKLGELIGVDTVTELEFRVMPRRMEPRTESSPVRQALLPDDAEAIADPILGRVYKASRKRMNA